MRRAAPAESTKKWHVEPPWRALTGGARTLVACRGDKERGCGIGIRDAGSGAANSSGERARLPQGVPSPRRSGTGTPTDRARRRRRTSAADRRCRARAGSVPNAPSWATSWSPAARATVRAARVSRLVSPTCAPTMTPMPRSRAASITARERISPPIFDTRTLIDPLRWRVAEQRQLVAPQEALVEDDRAAQRRRQCAAARRTGPCQSAPRSRRSG